MASAKKAPAHKPSARSSVSAKQPPAKAAPAKKAASAATKSASAKKTTPATAPSAKKAPAAAKPAPAKPAPAKVAPSKAVPAKAAAKAPAKAAPTPTPTPAKSAAPTRTAPPAKAPVKKAAPVAPAAPSTPAPIKGEKDGVKFTKDFDAKFLLAQRTLLLQEREALTGQAVRLENEANALIEEQEMGDVQFDDEGGEGDTMVVERERDLALSAQARQTIADIDAALERLTHGTYGYSLESGRPIARERLEAIPWATVLVEEKVGGIGRR
jgi:RNA polymerase-binding transcription factor DksA